MCFAELRRRIPGCFRRGRPWLGAEWRAILPHLSRFAPFLYLGMTHTLAGRPVTLSKNHMALLLLVDDDQTLLNLLPELFSAEHLCHTVANAEEALGHLVEHNYDLVITDLSMPGMSGEDLLGFIKVYRPQTPVLFISGSRDEGRAQRLATKGAFDYLHKPFQLQEINGRVARATRHGQRHRHVA